MIFWSFGIWSRITAAEELVTMMSLSAFTAAEQLM